MTQNIYATFANPENAQKAAGALLDYGVRSEHISVIFPEGYNHADLNRTDHGENAQKSAEQGISTTTPGDATIGAEKGAGLGLAAGAIAALAAVFIPGVGLVIGGGALALALGGAAGATAAGAIAGGVTGYLKDQGASDETITRYNEAIASGGATITVSPTDEKIDTATIENVITKYEGNLSYQHTGVTAGTGSTTYLG